MCLEVIEVKDDRDEDTRRRWMVLTNNVSKLSLALKEGYNLRESVQKFQPNYYQANTKMGRPDSRYMLVLIFPFLPSSRYGCMVFVDPPKRGAGGSQKIKQGNSTSCIAY